MAQTAAQQAPKRAKSAPQRGAAPDKEPKKAGLKTRLHDLPQAAGVVIMIAMLVLSLFIGNFRALQSATPKDFIRQGDVRSIVSDRIDAANNAAVVAERAGLDEGSLLAVHNAITALEQAKTAQEISRANQALELAVSALTAAELTGEESRNMLRAADDFAEQGSFLRQEARAFNEKAKKAAALYEKLPTKFMLSEPDVYEGI